MSITAVVTTAHMSINRRMAKHVVCPCNGICSATKRNEVLHATIQVDFENLALDERSHPQKVNYNVIAFLGNIQKWEVHRDRKQTSGSRDGRQGQWGRGDGRAEFPLGEIKVS